MRKPGRPLSESVNKKDVRLDLRIAKTEREAFKEAAEISGIPLSTWIRERLRRSAARELQEANRTIPFLAVP